ncbi:MAG: metallophosphoesterase, partial [Treponema sp.]|nr:metallophosphoesterase [Treponema sp.]
MTYCCSDLHGCFDEFTELLRKINFTGNDTMYVLGDNIDRGPKPIELLKYIYEHDNVISLMGNHERFLLDYIDSGFNAGDTSIWDKNNGKITRLAIDKLHKDDPVLCRNIADNIKTWDYCLILGPYILSHAGYNAKKLKNLPPGVESLKKMTQDEFLWSREEFFKCKGVDGYITIFGHTPARFIRSALNQKKSDDIWVCAQYEDKICIDG